MRSIIFCLSLLLISHNCISQTWDEWFKQRKTQRKYLLQQIAKLQVHLENVKKGYDIVRQGLNFIGQIKRGDLDLHQLFFSDLLRVKSVIRNYSGTQRLFNLYQRMMAESELFKKKMDDYVLLSAKERSIIRGSVEAFQNNVRTEMQSLLQLISDNELQMSDEERIKRIDQTLFSFYEKQNWLQASIGSINLLNAQRQKSLQDLNYLKNQFKK